MRRQRTQMPEAEAAVTLGNLGRCLAKGGRLEEADEAYSRAVAIKREVLGPDHPETLLTASNLHNLRALPDLSGRSRAPSECVAMFLSAMGCLRPRPCHRLPNLSGRKRVSASDDREATWPWERSPFPPHSPIVSRRLRRGLGGRARAGRRVVAPRLDAALRTAQRPRNAAPRARRVLLRRRRAAPRQPPRPRARRPGRQGRRRW